MLHECGTQPYGFTKPDPMPCRSCLNVLFQPIDDVEEHLFVHGFDSTYIKWIHHGDNRLESMNKDVNDKPSTKDSLQKTSVQICFDLISDESSSVRGLSQNEVPKSFMMHTKVDVAAVENMTLLEETVEEHGRILAAMQSQLAHITSWLQHFRSRQKPSQDTPSWLATFKEIVIRFKLMIQSFLTVCIVMLTYLDVPSLSTFIC